MPLTSHDTQIELVSWTKSEESLKEMETTESLGSRILLLLPLLILHSSTFILCQCQSTTATTSKTLLWLE